MPFTITATSSAGALAVSRPTAYEALEKCAEFEQGGYQKITVTDDKGRSLTRDQLALLAVGKT
ncbi:hypothetical protein QIH87_47580 [Bradyrhizobium elkanii]|uniref:hypothetical protein n=1 Tax=Bradyrhizobium elkanii TaxID=29448 RepID=UPI002714D12D|nr:hypothetical protein [Bradyrhizobium elkanii]WLB09512.1 hypothetical protein QIH87_47580 [Bradyrhizobium elkanii]WLB72541.1 hypothetical protein QIH89_00745 [Bradyrhizobium elkanii]